MEKSGPPEKWNIFLGFKSNTTVMEQQLINLLMKLMAKAGGGSLIKDLIRQVDENGNPKIWTESEMEKAIQYLNWQIENFGVAEARAVIGSLVRKFNLRAEDLKYEDPQPEVTGIQGLQ
jgi:hypothetical protein